MESTFKHFVIKLIFGIWKINSENYNSLHYFTTLQQYHRDVRFIYKIMIIIGPSYGIKRLDLYLTIMIAFKHKPFIFYKERVNDKLIYTSVRYRYLVLRARKCPIFILNWSSFRPCELSSISHFVNVCGRWQFRGQYDYT